jgi:hypothetical protein
MFCVASMSEPLLAGLAAGGRKVAAQIEHGLSCFGRHRARDARAHL